MRKEECQMCFEKKTKNSAFFAKYCPKKMAKSPKNHSKPLNRIFKFLIDLEPVVVLHKNRINPTKRCGENIYIEMKAERCHGWEKTKSFLHVLVRTGFTPLARKTLYIWREP